MLIHWPPGVESAIHHHDGLFGYVAVLEGELDNHFYRESAGRLSEVTIDRYGRGGLIPEPDGVIHKLRNNTDQRAVSLHFYYPALVDFDGMRIFNPEKGDIGWLSVNAKTASWSEGEGHFRKLERGAFTFEEFREYHHPKTHFITNVIPKPPAERIKAMNAAYFSEQAHHYDFSDFNQPGRKAYIDSIDRLIAEDVGSADVRKHLDIATGTGRRALRIRELSGLDYELHGVDISEEMCNQAHLKHVNAICHDWASETEFTEAGFDSVSFLYAFGHIADLHCRQCALRKIHQALRPGGRLYLDVFNLDNSNEWGPLARQHYEHLNLGAEGYDPGDVFYRKAEYDSIAFLHYFSMDEIRRLLEDSGFIVQRIQGVGYARNPGQLVDRLDNGNLFIIAVREGSE